MNVLLKILSLLLAIILPAELAAHDLNNQLDRYCLKLCYPDIIYNDVDDSINFKNGSYLKYKDESPANLSVSLQHSMRQVYPVEPSRPDAPENFAPGRERPYLFFNNLYGDTANEVKKNLINVSLTGKTFSLAKQPARAFQKVASVLENLARQKPGLFKYIKPEGGYYWRNIAGENKLSPHSYGIAVDIGVKVSPYWRWSRIMPHPLQQTYPAEIVEAFENNGFIWGGKWHEYDLMHYEYRPELICKSKMLQFAANPFAMKLKK